MTSRTNLTMPRNQPWKPDMGLVRDVTQPLPQLTDRSVRAVHIVVSCRGKSARAISTQGHNVRLAIWLLGWHIEIYDEFDDQLAALKQIVRPVTEASDAIGAPIDQSMPDPNAPAVFTRRPPPAARVVPRWRTRC